jgi:6-phosphofructokinase 1
MKSLKRIMVLTSGGDAPGMNAAIRAVVRTALAYDIEVLGCKRGFKGLVEGDIELMDHASVANLIQRGGTILKTTRFPEFSKKEVRQEAIEQLRKHKIDALVVLGGDGSFRGAKILAEESGLRVIGIPCTIDNDILGTEYTIGFDTARNTAIQAIDKIRDTAFSHNNNFLVEVMGRAAGFLAMDVGIAGGAEYIVLPEMPFSVEHLIDNISSRNRFKLGSIIVVAEADNPGRSFQLAKNIQEKTNILYKVCVLGHTQRGGTPTVRDRRVASLMGYAAVKALIDGYNEKMVAYNAELCTLVDFPDPALGARKLDMQHYLDINRVLCG